MPMSAGRLRDAIVEVCPVVAVSVGNPTGRETWSFIPTPEATSEQITAGENVVATVPVDGQGFCSNTEFMLRFSDAEYIKLSDKRRQNENSGNISYSKLWDITVVAPRINMNKKNTQDLKAALVADTVLTQARADEIFSMTTTLGDAGKRRAFPFD